MRRYIVNKYSGGVYCGNAFCETLDKCYEFANDGFCDKMKINDTKLNIELTVKMKGEQ